MRVLQIIALTWPPQPLSFSFPVLLLLLSSHASPPSHSLCAILINADHRPASASARTHANANTNTNNDRYELIFHDKFGEVDGGYVEGELNIEAFDKDGLPRYPTCFFF